MKVRLFFIALLAGAAAAHANQKVKIQIDPTTSRIIVDEAELDRTKFFGLCHHGRGFKKDCKDDKRFKYLIDQGITFGRSLGPINAAVKWGGKVQEDPERPGFVDLDHLKEKYAEEPYESEPEMVKLFGRLDVAAHGNHNAYPKFMGEHYTSQSKNAKKKPEYLPKNVEAAAELAAHVLKYGYNDFDRPAFFEPVNEPHWSFDTKRHLAEWHLAVLDKMHEMVPSVKVGGPCLATSNYYKDGYKGFRGLAGFIEATECRMDFYSFHTYDYLRDGGKDFGGRINSGLTLESILDLIQNHAVNKYGKNIDLVLSEHGGYEGKQKFTEKLAKRHLSGSGFKWEVKKRSIADFNMVNSAIANTMSFINHPHVVKKAVPFILLQSMNWDPTYYSTLYAPYNYKDKDRWVASQLINFYKFWRGIEGRYVKILCEDPDIQTVAFVHEDKLFIILNNLSTENASVNLGLKNAPRMVIRRHGRNKNFTPYFEEKRLSSIDNLMVKGRESVAIMLGYNVTIPEKRAVTEIPYYGDKTAVSAYNSVNFTVVVPQEQPIDYAVLRVGISRPYDADKEVGIKLNGQDLIVPVENCAERLTTDEGEYATTKLVYLDPQLVQGTNRVAVFFPDENAGHVGSVVIRAAHTKAKPSE